MNMDPKILMISKIASVLCDSSSSDSSDDDELFLLAMLHKVDVIPRTRCRDYAEEIVPSFTSEEFRQHFRMNRTTFEAVVQLCEPHLAKQGERYGRNPVSPRKQLLMAIWFMATPNSYRCISDRFGVGETTAWRSVQRVVQVLYAHVKTFIKWPTAEEAEWNVETVQRRYGFPGTIGAVDGTHIKIAAPNENSETYVNRKGFHSMQLQVICNPQLEFIHCYAGQVGSVHDMRVLRLSQFEQMCTNANFPNDSHILGDAAYQISKYIMVPFKDNGHLGEAETLFNYRLSSARMMVERSIGLLKGRFRSLLDTFPARRIDLLPKYVIACCILHNICLLHNDINDIPIIVNDAGDIQRAPIENANGQEGVNKRNAIMYNLNGY